MSRVPNWLGWLWLVVGGAGVVAAVVGTVVGLAVLTSTSDRSRQALSSTDQLVASGSEAIESLAQALSETTAALETVETSLAVGSATLTDMAGVTAQLGSVVSEDVPASLDAVHQAMPQLIATAGVLDNTMRALSLFGVDYNPAEPLDEALLRVDSELAALPAELRSQTEELDAVVAGIDGFGAETLNMAADVAVIRARLLESSLAMTKLSGRAGQTAGMVDDLTNQFTGQLELARWLLVLFGGSLLVAQSVPLVIGWLVVTGRQEAN